MVLAYLDYYYVVNERMAECACVLAEGAGEVNGRALHQQGHPQLKWRSCHYPRLSRHYRLGHDRGSGKGHH